MLHPGCQISGGHSHTIHSFCLSTTAVWKVRELTLLLRVGTLWRCGEGIFFEVLPLASDVLFSTLHPLLENILQTVCHKLQEDSGAGGFDLGAPFSWLEEPRNRMGARSGLHGGCSNVVPLISVGAAIATFQSRNAVTPLRLLRQPKKGYFKTTVNSVFENWVESCERSASLAKGGT
jgi:hypothetical protein